MYVCVYKIYDNCNVFIYVYDGKCFVVGNNWLFGLWSFMVRISFWIMFVDSVIFGIFYVEYDHLFVGIIFVVKCVECNFGRIV